MLRAERHGLCMRDLLHGRRYCGCFSLTYKQAIIEHHHVSTLKHSTVEAPENVRIKRVKAEKHVNSNYLVYATHCSSNIIV